MVDVLILCGHPDGWKEFVLDVMLCGRLKALLLDALVVPVPAGEAVPLEGNGDRPRPATGSAHSPDCRSGRAFLLWA